VWKFFIKLKTILPVISNLTSGYLSQGFEIGISTSILIEVVSITAKSWNQSKWYSLVNTNKENVLCTHTHTEEHYFFKEKRKCPMFIATLFIITML
jgi:hypothetical protein